MTFGQISQFLQDDRPEVRGAAVAMLADGSIEDGETHLVRAIADPSPIVWEPACDALRFRQPWLALSPFPERQVKEAVLQTTWGKAWSRLRTAIRQWLSADGKDIRMDILKRWLRLRGALPDIMEELDSIGQHMKSKALRAESIQITNQIILSPTYQCNLDCSYCYAKSWRREYNGDMEEADLDKALSWAKAQGIDYIIFGGGEPTIYSRFDRLVELAYQKRMKLHLTTNTLYPDNIHDVIRGDRIELLISHYEQDALKNRSDLHERYIRNIRAAQSRGVPVILRYTLTERSDPSEWGGILDFAGANGIETINYGFAFKSYRGDNDFYSYCSSKAGRRFEEVFVSFIDDCRLRNLTPHLSKPLPLCAISERPLRRFLLDGTLTSACSAPKRGYSQNLTINPDLTTFPCNAIGIKGPSIANFDSLEDAGRYYADFLRKLLFHPYYEKCTGCLFHYRGFCQGACLAEHYAMTSERNYGDD
jgi:radical SAM protein with 4Fe4S-binding SPASM domain